LEVELASSPVAYDQLDLDALTDARNDHHGTKAGRGELYLEIVNVPSSSPLVPRERAAVVRDPIAEASADACGTTVGISTVDISVAVVVGAIAARRVAGLWGRRA